MPNFWKAQTEPRSLALWKNTDALRGGGMEWGREYGGAGGVKEALKPDTEGPFRSC